MCILRLNLGNKVVFNNLFVNTYLRYSILGKIAKVKVALEPIIWEKRSKNAKNTRFFVNKCVFLYQLWALKWYSTIYLITTH